MRALFALYDATLACLLARTSSLSMSSGDLQMFHIVAAP